MHALVRRDIGMRRAHPDKHIDSSVDILIIDPSASDACRTSLTLQRAIPNVSIVRALHADQALRLMFEHGLFTIKPQIPRLIVIDVGAVGDAWLERVCGDARTCTLPVIVHSASGESRVIERCYSLGARAYVVKRADAGMGAEVAEAASGLLQNPPTSSWREQRHETVAHLQQSAAFPVERVTRLGGWNSHGVAEGISDWS
jgi:two-component system, response regulator